MTEALALSREWSAIGVGEMLAFPGTSERPERQVSVSAGELMRNIFSLLEDLVLCTIQKRTAVDFWGRQGRGVSKVFRSSWRIRFPR
jgi:hypothetical protein